MRAILIKKLKYYLIKNLFLTLRTNVRKFMSDKYFHPLIVKKCILDTADALSITFEIPPDLKSTFQFLPGQYLTLRKVIHGEDIRRSYSIYTSPEMNELSVLVKRIPQGKFTTYIHSDLKEGDILDVMPPMGNFLLQIPQPNHIVCFGAGSGITPLLSHISHLLNTTTASITLFYGSKTQSDIIFRDKIDALKNKYVERFNIWHILSREKMSSKMQKGRIDKEKCHLFNQYIVPYNRVDAFMLCGPAEMIFILKETLLALGVDPSKIKYELFTTADIPPRAKGKETPIGSEETLSKVVFKIDGDIIELPEVHGNTSLLDAALAYGADLPFACKGGVCSTCKAKLIKGKVHMPVNYALEKDELDNGFILTCQAYAQTNEIMVDFDQK